MENMIRRLSGKEEVQNSAPNGFNISLEIGFHFSRL
jgi:hypothetical protein